jgi:Family of unknown function (DUF6519)
MNGKFYPDITRDMFHFHKHFSRVIMQQGRVQLDSDWNEQVDILLHYMRTFIADLIGPFGCFDDGFKVEQYRKVEQVQEVGRGKGTKRKAPEVTQPTDVPYHFLIKCGHYYVNGILCENDRSEYIFSIPPSMRPASAQTEATQGSGDRKDDALVSYCFYLDVWEREVTYLEDPLLREVALGGPDTTTRSEVVCKVHAVKSEDTGQNSPDPDDKKYLNEKGDFQASLFASDWATQLQTWKESERGRLQAKTVDIEQSSQEPCVVSPTSQYRGMENQLYRVEIHEGSRSQSSPTFKWSRENGAVMFPIIGPVAGGDSEISLILTLGNLGRDDSRFSLSVDDWVEIVAIGDELEGEPGPLMYVQQVELASRQVTLASTSKNGITVPEHALFVRRWDYHEGDPNDRPRPKIVDSGALQITEGAWLPLEHGIQVRFVHEENVESTYHTGDYWHIPARTAIGTIEWPRHNDHPDSLPPHGVKHSYAPLCHARLTGGKIAHSSDLIDLRRVIER